MNTTQEAKVVCNQEEQASPKEAPSFAQDILEDINLESPRPALTLREAATFLGKSLRAIERSLLGKWGNKLPDGWFGKRVQTASGWEWRIIPPPGFHLRQLKVESSTYSKGRLDESCSAWAEPSLVPESLSSESKTLRLQYPTNDQPTIVIDRSDEVERLLRELLGTQKQLLEERRLRMEDLRLLNQANNSMRLLEDRASQTAQLKSELEMASLELRRLRSDYLELLALPWWKRIFCKVHKQTLT